MRTPLWVARGRVVEGPVFLEGWAGGSIENVRAKGPKAGGCDVDESSQEGQCQKEQNLHGRHQRDLEAGRVVNENDVSR